MMDFFLSIRSFKHEKNWEEEKLFVNSVPKSSINKTSASIKGSIQVVFVLSKDVWYFKNDSFKSKAETKHTEISFFNNSFAKHVVK